MNESSPFRPPDEGASDDPLPPLVTTGSYEYRDTSRLSAVLCGAVLFGALLSFAMLWIRFEDRTLDDRIASGIVTSQVEILRKRDELFRLGSAIQLAQLIWFWFGALLCLVWTYRTNGNAHSFGARGMRFGPPAAIGWYFVPIMNLFMPYRAVREIYQVSRDPQNWRTVKVPPVYPLWWTTYVALEISGFVTSFSSSSTDSLGAILSRRDLFISIEAVSILVTFAFVSVIRRIQSAQAETYLRIAERAGPE